MIDGVCAGIAEYFNVDPTLIRLGAVAICLAGGSGVDKGLFNVFEKAVLPRCGGAAAIKVRMAELGASAALMSGSGPSVFGVFDSAEAARDAETALRSEGYGAWYAQSV